MDRKGTKTQFTLVSDIAIFVLKRDVKLQLTNPVYTIQPDVKPVVAPVVSCKQTSNRLSTVFVKPV